MFFFLLSYTVSYIKANFKLKIDQKMYTFKIIEEVWKICKKIRKNEWQPFFYLKAFEKLIIFEQKFFSKSLVNGRGFFFTIFYNYI